VKAGSLDVVKRVLAPAALVGILLGASGCVVLGRPGGSAVGATCDGARVAYARTESHEVERVVAPAPDESRSYRAARPEANERSYKSASPKGAPSKPAPKRGGVEKPKEIRHRL
jgi:hypothetical protein